MCSLLAVVALPELQQFSWESVSARCWCYTIPYYSSVSFLHLRFTMSIAASIEVSWRDLFCCPRSSRFQICENDSLRLFFRALAPFPCIGRTNSWMVFQVSMQYPYGSYMGQATPDARLMCDIPHGRVSEHASICFVRVDVARRGHAFERPNHSAQMSSRLRVRSREGPRSKSNSSCAESRVSVAIYAPIQAHGQIDFCLGLIKHVLRGKSRLTSFLAVQVQGYFGVAIEEDRRMRAIDHPMALVAGASHARLDVLCAPSACLPRAAILLVSRI